MKASDAGRVAGAPVSLRDRLEFGAPVALAGRDGLTCLLALIVLLLATRPYTGIEQDGHLYAVQALRALGHAALDDDLVFRYGNQGDFALFGKLYAPAIDTLGLGRATFTFWLIGLCAWLASLLVLSRTVFGATRAAFIAAGLVLVLPAGYGNLLLSYGEAYVTPRPLSEALSMLALAAAWRGRLALAALPMLGALAVHPLTGLAALLVCAWIVVSGWKRFALLAAVGFLAALLLAWLGVGPFAWLLQRMDAEWFALTRLRDSIVYPTGWNGALIVAGLGLPGAVLVGVALSRRARLAGFAAGLLGLAAAMVAVSVVGADMLGNRLIAALQVWRVLLFVALFGNLLALFALRDLSPRGATVLAAAMALAATETALGMVPLGSAIVASGALLGRLAAFAGRAGPALGIAAQLVATLGGLLSLGLIVTTGAGLAGSAEGWKAALRLAAIALAMGWLVAPPAILRHRVIAPLALGLAALGLALVGDDRTAMQRFEVDGSAPLDAAVVAALGDGTVYWEDGVGLLWFKLRRPSYYSCRQKGGIQFFRGQAVEFERRAQALRGLNTDDFGGFVLGNCPSKRDATRAGPDHADDIAAACAAAGELDMLVLRSRVAGTDPFRFDLPVPPPDGGATATAFHLYRCADF